MNLPKNPDDLAKHLQNFDNEPSLASTHQWNPPFCGDIDIRITRDGRWHFNGSPIDREALVKLFASVLRRDNDDCYYLVTPVEKVRIQVDDAPFIITHAEVRREAAGVEYLLTTSVGDEVVLDKEHPLLMKEYGETGDVIPYVRIRSNLEARLHRNVFYQLVAAAQQSGDEVIITSRGYDLSLGNTKSC